MQGQRASTLQYIRAPSIGVMHVTIYGMHMYLGLGAGETELDGVAV